MCQALSFDGLGCFVPFQDPGFELRHVHVPAPAFLDHSTARLQTILIAVEYPPPHLIFCDEVRVGFYEVCKDAEVIPPFLVKSN